MGEVGNVVGEGNVVEMVGEVVGGEGGEVLKAVGEVGGEVVNEVGEEMLEKAVDDQLKKRKGK